MWTPWGDAARDRPTPQAVAGEGRRIELGKTGPVLDDQRDRIRCRSGRSRGGSAAVHALAWHPWRRAGRQLPDPAILAYVEGELGIERLVIA
jgi:hypothetical protein